MNIEEHTNETKGKSFCPKLAAANLRPCRCYGFKATEDGAETARVWPRNILWVWPCPPPQRTRSCSHTKDNTPPVSNSATLITAQLRRKKRNEHYITSHHLGLIVFIRPLSPTLMPMKGWILRNCSKLFPVLDLSAPKYAAPGQIVLWSVFTQCYCILT